MDESRKKLQVKLSELSHQLNSQSLTVDEVRVLKVKIQDLVEELDSINAKIPFFNVTSSR